MPDSDSLFELVYQELRQAARRLGPDRSLQPTDLVHEVFLRLRDRDWESPEHFRAVASVAMRQVVIDRSRRRDTMKRGGERQRITLSGLGSEPHEMDLIDVERVLQRLETMDSRKGNIVTMRIFGGMELNEIADSISVSLSTVKREWRTARAWLMAELS
ncbi:MAG: ECF-type sigma factor [Acidobacteriota bacterium]